MDSDSPASIAHYLADREGLHGSARPVFLNLLRNAFGFKLRRPRRVAVILAGWVAVVAVAGVAGELQRGWSIPTVSLWLGVVGLGGALVVGLVRNSRPPAPVNRELEWRVYCLLVRPVILAERPGLLDRNLSDDYGAKDHDAAFAPEPTVRELLRDDRRIHLWLPAATGWSVGAAALVLWQILTGLELWAFILPVVGALLGPLAWSMFRLMTFARVERAVREQR